MPARDFLNLSPNLSVLSDKFYFHFFCNFGSHWTLVVSYFSNVADPLVIFFILPMPLNSLRGRIRGKFIVNCEISWGYMYKHVFVLPPSIHI